MNLIEKWKNRETKKKLREENERLKSILTPYNNWSRFIKKRESEIQKIAYVKSVPLDCLIGPEDEVELIKADIKANIIKDVIPFIEFSDSDGLMGSKEVRGTLYVVKRNG